jgi:hypothetical protein
MDFENYTVGGLYESRSNYNRTHAGYVAGLAEIRGRIWHLGWRQDRFDKLDRELAEKQWRGGRADEPDRVDRYGKKYGWIAYYELAGRLNDAEGLPAEVTEHIVDIDPSFSDEPSRLPTAVPRWARPTPAKLSDWVRRGIVEVPDGLLVADALEGEQGPWVAVHAFLRDHNHLAGRRVWGTVQALLVTTRVAASIDASVAALTSWSETRWPEAPDDTYTMAGGDPWSPRFATSVLRYQPVPYRYELRLPVAGSVDAEVVVHRYGWESHHSTTNQQGGLMVPSRLVSQEMGLAKLPNGLDHVDGDGRTAARVFLSPNEFESGNLLYIRRDVLEAYARRRGVRSSWLCEANASRSTS